MSEYGTDILCAAVSTLGITLINYFLEYVKLDEEMEYYVFDQEVSDSLLSLNILDESILEMDKIQSGFNYFCLGIKALEESYEDNMMVDIQEV